SRSAKSKTRTIPVRMCAELAISRLHLAWFLSRDRLPAHKPAGSPSFSDLPFTGVRGRDLAQILAQDLADVRLRQIVAELDQSRHFVAGEFASAEIAHRLGVKRRIAAHDKS